MWLLQLPCWFMLVVSGCPLDLFRPPLKHYSMGIHVWRRYNEKALLLGPIFIPKVSSNTYGEEWWGRSFDVLPLLQATPYSWNIWNIGWTWTQTPQAITSCYISWAIIFLCKWSAIKHHSHFLVRFWWLLWTKAWHCHDLNPGSRATQVRCLPADESASALDDDSAFSCGSKHMSKKPSDQTRKYTYIHTFTRNLTYVKLCIVDSTGVTHGTLSFSRVSTWCACDTLHLHSGNQA